MWPPPVLPINRTNADPQQDTHPNDHNTLALAMNDTVTEVQRVNSVVQAIQNNNRTTRMPISTDANGDAFIPWTTPQPGPFPNTVFAVVVTDSSADVMAGLPVIIKVPTTGITLAGFAVKVFLHDGSIVANNGAIVVGYFAIGY